MEYVTVREASEKWRLGIRTITRYCAEGRIDAVKQGGLWLIPQNAARPKGPDGAKRAISPVLRNEEAAAVSQEMLSLGEQQQHIGNCSFPSLYENKELFVEIVKHFPYPMHICAPDGTLLLANEAFLSFARISDPERLYQQHNILLDPALERWGIAEFVQRAFSGEVVHAYDVKVPYQEVVNLLASGNQVVFGSMFHNMTAFPIRDQNNGIQYIVTVFTTSRQYLDREEIINGKEYIEKHWREAFDIHALATAVHMSRYHYTRLFKKHTGMTPYGYYQHVKIGKIKERLCDINLSVAQALEQCGEDYNGHFTRVFRRKVGMTPTQYRRMITEE